MNGTLDAIGALIPSVGVGLLFWFAIRAIFRADQRERSALRRLEAEQDAADAEARRAGAGDGSGAGGTFSQRRLEGDGS